MTLKHKNFNESIIMRSYVNKALEKGIISSEENYDTSFVMNAATEIKQNKSPQNLNDKILKLCSKLRNSGFETYADDLEKNFLTYKLSSQKMYDVSKETGEDVLNEAHPDGSKKIIEDATADMGVVETKIDQKSKIEKIVAKQPTGKLALNLAASIIKSSSNNNSNILKRYIKAYNTINAYKNNPFLFLKNDLNNYEKQYALKWLNASSAHLKNKIDNLKYLHKIAGSSDTESEHKSKSDNDSDNAKNFKKFLNDILTPTDSLNFISGVSQRNIDEYKNKKSDEIDEDLIKLFLDDEDGDIVKIKEDLKKIEDIIEAFKADYLK